MEKLIKKVALIIVFPLLVIGCNIGAEQEATHDDPVIDVDVPESLSVIPNVLLSANSHIISDDDLQEQTSVRLLYEYYKNYSISKDAIAKEVELTYFGFYCYYLSSDYYDEYITYANDFYSSFDALLEGADSLSIFVNYWASYLRDYSLIFNYLYYLKIDDIDNAYTAIDNFKLIGVDAIYKQENSETIYLKNMNAKVEDNKIIIDETIPNYGFVYFPMLFVHTGYISDADITLRQYVSFNRLEIESLKIKKIENRRITRERFPYLHSKIEQDEHYYDELEEYVIEKTLVQSSNYFDTYDVVFDADMICDLFEDIEIKA